MVALVLVIKYHSKPLSLRSKAAKVTLGVCATLVAIAAPLQLTSSAVHADQYDDQINALQSQVNQYQTQADQLQKQANSLQAAVDTLQAQINGMQAQINLSQAQYDQLTNQIAINKQKLADNQTALGQILADLYVSSGITPLEMLASSKNISEFMDKNTYQSSVRDKLNNTIDQIQTLKSQLQSEQQSVVNVLNNQRSQQATLAAEQQQQQQLLSQTQGSEAAYQQQIASTQAQISAVAAEQRAALQRITGGGLYNYGSIGSFQFRNYSGNMGCGGGGYPLCGAQDSYSDQWGLLNRECVSYAAWAAYTRFGKEVTNFSGAGNAYQWPSTAQSLMGATIDSTPVPGDVAILPPTPGFSPIGHAMVVESILAGGWAHVSQYNFGGTGEYSTMDIADSGVVFVHFQNR